jgi:hypothetical protein
MTMDDEDYWFAPKRYGIGTGLPISWQGWVATAVVTAIICGLVWLLGDRPLQLIAAVFPVAVLFTVICARKTRGGWRWRWGESE